MTDIVDFRLSAKKACKLMFSAYYQPADLEISESVSIEGVQADIVPADGLRVLVVHGTNEGWDWFRFNFRFLTETRDGDTRRWHSGFLSYANIVYSFAKNKNIDVIIGHSLGAAAAQIVGSSLAIPSICLASPRPLFGASQPDNAHYVVNICRVDDTICNLPPPFVDFHHVGPVHWLTPRAINVGEDHRVDKYIAAIEELGDPITDTIVEV